MKEELVLEGVKDVISYQLGVHPDQVTPEANFVTNLGADSLDTVELILGFEAKFHVEITDEEAEKVKTVGDAVELIKKRIK